MRAERSAQTTTKSQAGSLSQSQPFCEDLSTSRWLVSIRIPPEPLNRSSSVFQRPLTKHEARILHARLHEGRRRSLKDK
jgi:hypothetical protein